LKKKAAFLFKECFDNTIYDDARTAKIATHFDLAPTIIRPDALDAAAEILANVEILFSTWGMPVLNEEFLARAPKLRAVFYAAGSVKGFVTDLVWERGLIICSAWRANAIPVAEFSLGAILLSLKNFGGQIRLTRSGGWSHEVPVAGGFGSKVGIVSIGAVGRVLVGLLKNFDVEILAYDPFLAADVAAALGVRSVSLPELFAESDVISLHTPLIPETVGMINAPLLESMKHGASLINTSRGAIIDENALVATMRKRPDLTAWLDVTHPEPPPPDSPLRTLPNVFLTPHVAGSMKPEYGRMGEYMVREAIRYLSGDPLEHQVNKEMLLHMA
jgi:phosphoglycerate dehydrogenase-like enzyme